MTILDPLDPKLRERARTFEVVAVIALVMLAANLLAVLKLPPYIGAAIDALRGGDHAGLLAASEGFARGVIPLLPAVIYLGGVWVAAGMFGRMAKGELFSEANARGVAEIGSSLLWGAAASAVIVPMLLLWAEGRHGGVDLRLAPETLVIAVIGGALMVLGGVLARGVAVLAERDGLKAQMDEFV